MKNLDDKIQTVSFSILFFLLLFFSHVIGLNNIKGYVLSIIIILIIFLIWYEVIRNKKMASEIFNGGEIITITYALFAIVDKNTLDMLGRITNHFPYKLYLFCYAFSLLTYVIVVIIQSKKSKEIENIAAKSKRKNIIENTILCCAIVAVVALFAWQGYLLNCNGGQYSFFNGNAFWTSVSQVFHGIAFDDSHFSFYGHYALLMAPFFQIFGLNIYTLAASQVLEYLIVAILGIYCGFKFIDRFAYRIVFLVLFSQVVLWSPMWTIVYPQAQPHRWLFTIIILFILLIKRNSNKLIWKILLFITSVLSIIWNLDTGIAIILGLSVYFFADYLLRIKPTSFKDKIMGYLNLVLYPTVVFFASYVFTNVLNIFILHGKWLSIKLFMIPYFDSSYMSMLPAELSWKAFFWIIWVIILLISLLEGIYKVLEDFKNSNNNNEISAETEILLFLSVNGVICLTYFFNRPAIGNIYFVGFFQVLYCSVILIKNHKWEENRYSKRILQCCLLSYTIYSLGTGLYLLSDNVNYHKTANNPYNAMQTVLQIDKELDNEDYIFFGYGDWFMELMDNHIVPIEMSILNTNQTSIDAIKNKLIESNLKIICPPDTDLLSYYGKEYTEKHFTRTEIQAADGDVLQNWTIYSPIKGN